jgi:sporulation protein YlmC with PRC-barrel domain
MDIPVNAEMYCTDGICGRSSCVIINPVSREVTHVVAKEKRAPHTEHLVPVKWVTETTRDLIRLHCTSDELAKMEPFIETEYIRETIEGYEHLDGGYMLWPYRLPKVKKTISVAHKRIPHGELAVQRGARVHATDGPIGRVDEFLVEPESGHITHLVLREGHLWDPRDVTIPISEIDRIEENAVHLKLDKHSVEVLPVIPVRR